MFADRNATAMIPAKDLARAISWYEQKLGLKPARSDEYGASYELTGVKAFLYQTQFAGTAQHTLLSFNSADLLADDGTFASYRNALAGTAFLEPPSSLYKGIPAAWPRMSHSARSMPLIARQVPAPMPWLASCLS